MKKIAKPFCSYCNKSLTKTDDERVIYKVALYLQSGDSVIQVCQDCAIQVFVQYSLSQKIDTESLIDLCDNILIRS